MPYVDLEDCRLHYRFDGPEGAPVVLFGNSLGTDFGMWDAQAEHFGKRFRVLRYDMRGHNERSVTPGPYTLEQLGRDALHLLQALGIERVHYVGLSLGGMVGMWLAVNAPQRIARLALCNTAAHMPPPETWNARIDAVNAGGMEAIVPGILERWFTAGFRERAPDSAARIADMLRIIPREGYVAAAAAVRDMDQREGIARIAAPTLVIAGSHDPATPPAMGRFLASNIAGARYVELPAAHLSNIEAEAQFNAALQAFLDEGVRRLHEQERYEEGMEVRRAVLGDAHVDRSLRNRNDFNNEFQDLITRYAWGEIWTRPGLPRHTRSLITLAMMVALNRADEFRLHVRAAANNGVTREEIREVLLQTAVYCGVPAANTAFHLAQQVFQEMDGLETRN
jgi:3-oxoadipate enol-lactonase/4-carboxymuconolactone decarboxylase